MSNSKVNNNFNWAASPLFLLATIILLILKVSGNMEIDWVWVFAPLWIPIGISLGFVILVGVVAGLIYVGLGAYGKVVEGIRNYRQRRRDNQFAIADKVARQWEDNYEVTLTTKYQNVTVSIDPNEIAPEHIATYNGQTRLVEEARLLTDNIYYGRHHGDLLNIGDTIFYHYGRPIFNGRVATRFSKHEQNGWERITAKDYERFLSKI